MTEGLAQRSRSRPPGTGSAEEPADARSAAEPGGAREGAALRVDVAVVGGGGAGLALVHALARRDAELTVAVVDPVARTGNDRTWCFWAPSPTVVDGAVEASWRRVRVAGADRSLELDLAPMRYHLVRSADFYALVEAAVARCRRLRVTRLPARAASVEPGPAGARVRTEGGATSDVVATWVFDSRPTEPVTSGTVWWWQHFRGWVLPAGTVPAASGAAQLPTLMDFGTQQPERGLSFGYCLPLADGRHLVEYTEFSPARLDDAGYDAGVHAYLERLGVPAGIEPDEVENGAIPMTDARFARGAGPGVVRLGTAGGATRGSTGYTFAAMLRQAEAAADALVAGRPAVPPPAYPARHRWLDGILLRALDRGYVDGPEFFLRLFAGQPTARVLRFLDGTTSPLAELAVMAGSPIAPMLRAVPPWPRRPART